MQNCYENYERFTLHQAHSSTMLLHSCLEGWEYYLLPHPNRDTALAGAPPLFPVASCSSPFCRDSSLQDYEQGNYHLLLHCSPFQSLILYTSAADCAGLLFADKVR